MTKIPTIIALAVALSGCAEFGLPGSSGTTGAASNGSVGVTGTASDAISNLSGSTSTSMEEQRIKQQHGGTAPTSYENQTHFPS